MRRTLFSTLAATLALSLAPAVQAEHHEESSMLETVLAADIRADDNARDVFRHPQETLTFFGLKPDMIVGEYGPGGGWYTRILAPYLDDEGAYVALNADVDRYMAGADEERMTAAKAFPETFPGRVAEWTGLDAESIAAYEIDETPEDVAKSLDAVLFFRGLHGLQNRGMADDTIRDAYDLLKPGGIVGVVQHRAKEDAPQTYVRGQAGYLKQSQVIALFASEGFELVDSSEINANAKDPANHEGGVWTLPPTLRYGDENKEEYLAIGESDRMTLLFKKPEA